MNNPVIYYDSGPENTGEIRAVAAAPLPSEDVSPSWAMMRITEGEWKMFIEGNEPTTNWYVLLDMETNVRRLRNREQKHYRSYSKLNPISEAIVGLESPDLIIERGENGIYVRITNQVTDLERYGEAVFWLTKEQDQSVVYGYRKVRFDFTGEGRRWLFIEPDDVRTTIYTNSRFQRLRDDR